MSCNFYGLSRYLFFGQDLLQDQLFGLHTTVAFIQQTTTWDDDYVVISLFSHSVTNILQPSAVEGDQSKGTRLTHNLQITSELLQG